MKLKIIIEEDDGEVITSREYKAEDVFDIDLRDWEEDKQAIVQEVINN